MPTEDVVAMVFVSVGVGFSYEVCLSKAVMGWQSKVIRSDTSG